MVRKTVKRAFKYRFYPTDAQTAELSRTFGCVRLVFFPSSKLCSACGSVQEKMPLSIRTWTCACGITHDRDVNAAINLKAAGLAVSAGGAGVRPQRESSRTGLSVVKQEGHGVTRDGARAPNHR